MTSVRVKKERRYSPHHTLQGAARVCLELAKAKQPGFRSHEFTTIVMSAFSLEALANAVGARVVADWTDFESSSPWAKLRVLCETLGLDFQRNQEPWSSAKWLCGFRNRVAHGRPQDLLTDVIVAEQAFQNEFYTPPSSALESEITLGNAVRAYEAVIAIKLAFFNGLPDHLKTGINSDSTIYHGSVG